MVAVKRYIVYDRILLYLHVYGRESIYRIYSNKRPGVRVDIYFSDFTLKTPIFNQICLFDDEKVHFEHITKQF